MIVEHRRRPGPRCCDVAAGGEDGGRHGTAARRQDSRLYPGETPSGSSPSPFHRMPTRQLHGTPLSPPTAFPPHPLSCIALPVPAPRASLCPPPIPRPSPAPTHPRWPCAVPEWPPGHRHALRLRRRGDQDRARSGRGPGPLARLGRRRAPAPRSRCPAAPQPTGLSRRSLPCSPRSTSTTTRRSTAASARSLSTSAARSRAPFSRNWCSGLTSSPRI